MKYILLPLFFLGLFLMKAQESNPSQIALEQSEAIGQLGANEFKINLLTTLIGIPEITYERILQDNSAFGISAMVGFDEDVPINFMAIPYYRIYFGKKIASGFFIEAGIPFVSQTEENYVYTEESNQNNYPYYEDVYKEYTEFGVGLSAAVGVKFLTRNGLLGELTGGVGRLFGVDEVPNIVPRVGISIGKRF